MLKHIILWTLKPELSEEEKNTVRRNTKEQLEALAGKIEGLVSIRVHINGLATSNTDMMLDSVFTDKQALARYASHPLHVAAADNYIRPYYSERRCFDFEE
ncbi:MAG: Dabb family protein [Ruminococcaceae bacterium]|nr:Dabb family protein [Oscillospiraceae bacterium]